MKILIGIISLCCVFLFSSIASAEVWYVTENAGSVIWHDVWTKKSGEKPGPIYFTASRDEQQQTYDLTLYWADNNTKVFAERRHDTSGWECDYDGQLVSSKHVSGKLYCSKPDGENFIRTWDAYITPGTRN